MIHQHPLYRYSWMVRLTQATQYEPLFERHRPLAFEAVPHQRDGYSFRRLDEFENWDGVGLSDLQYQPGNPSRLLGSCRSVHVSDHYLKGVGLTPLFPTLPIEYFHGSGHLFPSAAAREYLISEWVKGLGLERWLVPCTGILVAPMDEGLKAVSKEIYYPNGNHTLERRVPECDLYLKAISIKPGPFLRFSNFEWLVHFGVGETLGELEGIIRDWYHEALGDDGASLPYPEDDIELALQRIEIHTRIKIEQFFSFQKNGITWTSMNNNFTAGLRFLDLEIPLVTEPGIPFGIVNPSTTGNEYPARIELFQMVRQVRMFVLDLIGWCEARALRAFGSQNPALQMVRDFLEHLGALLRDVFLKNSSLFDDVHWIRYVADHYQEIWGTNRSEVMALVQNQARLFLHSAADVLPDHPARMILSHYSFELGKVPNLCIPRWLPHDSEDRLVSGDHAFFAMWNSRIGAQRDVASFLAAVREAGEAIQSRFRGRARQ